MIRTWRASAPWMIWSTCSLLREPGVARSVGRPLPTEMTPWKSRRRDPEGEAMRKTMCVLFWLMVNVQPVFSGEIPEVLHIPNAGTPYPAWVAADRVLTPSGEVDPALFSVSDRFIISGALQQPPREGCIRWGHEQEVEEITVGSKKAVRQNLASTAKSAGWVFSATVTARATGFNSSVPGTLLEVVPEETFKGPRDRAGIHYVFFPVGTF